MAKTITPASFQKMLFWAAFSLAIGGFFICFKAAFAASSSLEVNVDDLIEYTADSSKLSAEWSLVDGSAEVDHYEIAVSDDNSASKLITVWENVGLAASAEISGLSLVQDEDYYFCVKAVGPEYYDESAGASTSETMIRCSDGVICDAVAPTTLIEGNFGDYVFGRWSKEGINIELGSAADDLENIYYCWGGNCQPADFSPYIEALYVNSNGESIINYFSRDWAGNEELAQAKMIRIDDALPELDDYPEFINLDNQPALELNGQAEAEATINYVFRDEVAGEVSGTTLVSPEESFVIDEDVSELADGLIELSFWIDDSSQLRGTATVNMTKDTELAEFSFVSPTPVDGSATSAAAVNLAVEINEEMELCWLNSNIGSGTSSEAIRFSNDNGQAAAEAVLAGLNEGVNYYSFTCRDLAGNYATSSWRTIYSYLEMEEILGIDFALPDDGAATSTLSATTTGAANVEFNTGAGTSTVSLATGTVITSPSGTFDLSVLAALEADIALMSGFGASYEGIAAVKWGLLGIELNFDPAITVELFLGSDYEGLTLPIMRSVSGTDAWTSDGIVSPAVCTVTNGYCVFQATKASYYAAFSQTDNGDGSNNSGGGGVIITPDKECSAVNYGPWEKCWAGWQSRKVLSQSPLNCALTAEQIAQQKKTCFLPPVQPKPETTVETGGDEEPELTSLPRIKGIKTYGIGELLRGPDKKIYLVIAGGLERIYSLDQLKAYAGQTIYDVSDQVLIANGVDNVLVRRQDKKIYHIYNRVWRYIANLEELKKFAGRKIFDINN